MRYCSVNQVNAAVVVSFHILAVLLHRLLLHSSSAQQGTCVAATNLGSCVTQILHHDPYFQPRAQLVKGSQRMICVAFTKHQSLKCTVLYCTTSILSPSFRFETSPRMFPDFI